MPLKHMGNCRATGQLSKVAQLPYNCPCEILDPFFGHPFRNVQRVKPLSCRFEPSDNGLLFAFGSSPDAIDRALRLSTHCSGTAQGHKLSTAQGHWAAQGQLRARLVAGAQQLSDSSFVGG